MISYLSQPYKSTVEPYKENVGLIAQVAQQKQSKYDNILSTIFQKQNQLLNLDTSQGSEEAEIKKDNLLKEADNQLNKFATSDLTIPDNISKVENIFTPIINDKDIMGAASITAFTKEQAAYFDEWKKEGKGLYDAKNEAYFWEQVNKNREMSLKDVKEKGYIQPTSVEFVDIDKFFNESITDLMPDITSVESPDGNGRIFMQKNKVLSESDILALLPTNSKILAQAEINAYFDYQNVAPENIINAQKDNIIQQKNSDKSIIDYNNLQIQHLKKELSEIERNTTSGKNLLNSSGLSKEDYINKLNEKINNYIDDSKNREFNFDKYDSQINYINKTFKFNPLTNTYASIDDNFLNNMKTSLWLNNRKNSFAKAKSYTETDFSIKTDEVELAHLQHQYDIEMDDVETINNIMEKAYEDGLKTPNTASPSNPSDIFSPVVGKEKYDIVELKEGDEYHSLAAKFGELKQQSEKLPNLYIDKLKIYNPSYNQQLLNQDEQKVRKVLDDLNNPSIKLTDKIPGSEQTYQSFLADFKNKDILEYIQQKDAYKSYRTANIGILSDIENRAKAKALADSNYDLNEPIKINTQVPAAPVITIPNNLKSKYLNNSLSDEDIKEIIKLNGFEFITESGRQFEIVKHLIETKSGNDKLDEYREKLTYYKNKFAKDYNQGYTLSSLYIKDPITTSSMGSKANTDAIQFIKAQLDESYKNKNDIQIKRFYKDPKSPSGWSVEAVAYETTINSKGETIKSAPKKINEKLNATFVKNYGLDKVLDVSNIQKSLELQKVGNPTKNPEFLYTYLGKSYKFIKFDEGVKLLEMLPDKTFYPLHEGYSDVDKLLSLIQKQRQLEIFNR